MKKIIIFIRKFLKEEAVRSSRKIRKNRVKQLHDTFTIDERNDKIYIICGSTPVYEAPPDETAKSVILRIEKMRKAAYRYYNVYAEEVKSNN